MEKIGYFRFYSNNINITDNVVDLSALNNTLSGIHDSITLCSGTNQKNNLKIPISINKGSVVAEIYHVLSEFGLDKTILASTALMYLGATATKAANSGITSTGLYIDTKKAMLHLVKLVKLIKHVGGMKFDEYIKKNSHLQENNGISTIKIRNNFGIELEIEYEVFKLYLESRSTIFKKLTELVEEDVICQIVYMADNDNEIIEEITANEKCYFQNTDEDDELVEILPEYEHEQRVELDGKIVKLHEDRDTVGIKINGHIITCIPAGRQHIAMYKDLLVSEQNEKIFANVKIIGVINRFDRKGTFLNKPQILFNEIIQIDSISNQQNLF